MQNRERGRGHVRRVPSAVHEVQPLEKSAKNGVVSMVRSGESAHTALRFKQTAAKELERHKSSHLSSLTSQKKNLAGIRKQRERGKTKKMLTIRRHTLRS